MRLCVDYRRLNSVSKINAYPMPHIDELLDRLRKAQFISMMDVTRRYWQIPVALKDKHKTAFYSLFGFFQFQMKPFGLHEASATFQRMMDPLIHGAHDFTAVYLDDLVIYSTTWEDHLYHLQTVLLRLPKAGLTAKPSKCQYGTQQCVYLGYTVAGGILEPEVGKLQAIQH